MDTPLSTIRQLTTSWRRLTWTLGAAQFISLVTLANIATYHVPLVSYTAENLEILSINGIATVITLMAVVIVISFVLLALLFMLSQHLVKPFCILMVLINSVAVYFMLSYQVILDKTMIANILNTNFDESVEFLNPRLIFYFVVLGMLPASLLLKIEFQKTRRLKLLTQTTVTVLVCLIWIFSASNTWLWIDEHSKRLGGRILPWSYIIGLARHQVANYSRLRPQILLPPARFTNNDKSVVVLVIGEAARAANFSLYGYNKPTNPLLEKTGVAVLKNSFSCSTYTTASMRCILSHKSNNNLFSEQYEPLPSYLHRHGVEVIWRSNNWGEPPVEVDSYERSKELKKDCSGDDCTSDGVLISKLAERISTSKKDKVLLILHQKGSHGPTYYKRYPEQFEKFKPVCKSVELQNCSNTELLNAYDNTILYNDYLLNQTIAALKTLNNTSSMLMYLSDHGESLGENNLYLHGTPFTLAPDVQIRIPFLVWMSENFMQTKGVSLQSISSGETYSQANVFHSIMGALAMQSDIYDKELDIFNKRSRFKTSPSQ